MPEGLAAGGLPGKLHRDNLTRRAGRASTAPGGRSARACRHASTCSSPSRSRRSLSEAPRELPLRRCGPSSSQLAATYSPLGVSMVFSASTLTPFLRANASAAGPGLPSLKAILTAGPTSSSVTSACCDFTPRDEHGETARGGEALHGIAVERDAVFEQRLPCRAARACGVRVPPRRRRSCARGLLPEPISKRRSATIPPPLHSAASSAAFSRDLLAHRSLRRRRSGSGCAPSRRRAR